MCQADQGNVSVVNGSCTERLMKTEHLRNFLFFGTEFILILLISLSVTSTKRLAAILIILVLLYLPTGEFDKSTNLTN